MQSEHQRLLVDDLATEIICETVASRKSSIIIGPLLVPLPPADVLPTNYVRWIADKKIHDRDSQDAGGEVTGKWRRVSAGAVGGMMGNIVKNENGNGMKSSAVKAFNLQRYFLRIN